MLPSIILLGCLSLITASELLPEAEPNARGGCAVSVLQTTGDNWNGHQPLLLSTGRKKREFLYPENREGLLRIPAGKSIYLACPGNGNYLQAGRQLKETIAGCIGGQRFVVDGETRDFSSLTCKYVPGHITKRTGKLCMGRYETIVIGFELKGALIELIEICRDDRTFETFYSKFQMTKQALNFQRNYPRPKWAVGDFFPGLDVHTSYKVETQRGTIGKILNSTKLADEFIKTSVQFLSRGHLTAKADFVYGAQQDATFWYINVAPQWQSFNAGNWLSLEDNVRRFATTARMDLEVYTGVHGIMTLEDVRGKHQPIYLHHQGYRRALPVPKFYWKVIYDPISKRGTAFVGVNDPFMRTIGNDVYLCEDISFKIKWLTWSPRNITRGVSYACSIDDFRRAVPSVPPLNVVDILR